MSADPAITQGLRDLADYLDTANVPRPRAFDVRRHLEPAMFDKLAAANEAEGLGFTLSDENGSYPILTRMFGPVKLEFQTDGEDRREAALRRRMADLERREAAVAARENGEQA